MTKNDSCMYIIAVKTTIEEDRQTDVVTLFAEGVKIGCFSHGTCKWLRFYSFGNQPPTR